MLDFSKYKYNTPTQTKFNHLMIKLLKKNYNAVFKKLINYQDVFIF